MLKHIKESKWKGKKVLFIHTGGQLGLFSQPMPKSLGEQFGIIFSNLIHFEAICWNEV